MEKKATLSLKMEQEAECRLLDMQNGIASLFRLLYASGQFAPESWQRELVPLQLRLEKVTLLAQQSFVLQQDIVVEEPVVVAVLVAVAEEPVVDTGVVVASLTRLNS